MLSGTHENARTTFDWNVGASRGERETPYRVDWEFRSGANAFPNSYDVSDPELVRVTSGGEFLRRRRISVPPRAVPRRHRARGCGQRRGQPEADDDAWRRATAFWKAGAKVVDARQAAGSHQRELQRRSPRRSRWRTSASAASVRSILLRRTCASVRRSNLPGLKEFFAANPSRFVFDAVTTAQNSVEQDFTADEQRRRRLWHGAGRFRALESDRRRPRRGARAPIMPPTN